jgi:hypothetical protein
MRPAHDPEKRWEHDKREARLRTDHAQIKWREALGRACFFATGNCFFVPPEPSPFLRRNSGNVINLL